MTEGLFYIQKEGQFISRRNLCFREIYFNPLILTKSLSCW